MRLPAPVFGAVQSAKYREIHTQLPIPMRVFMWSAQMSALLLVAVIVAAFSRQLGYLTWWLGSMFLPLIPAYNVLVPLGFRLFSWLVRQA